MQSPLVRQLEHAEVTQQTATVVAVEAPWMTLRCGTGELRARRAASCLIEPAEGDLVLLAVPIRGPAYVLAVLERLSQGPLQIATEGDTSWRVSKGSFSVEADEGIRLVARTGASLVAGAFKVVTGEATLVARGLSMLATAARAEIDRLRLVAGSVEQKAERVTQHLGRSLRQVDELDQVRAKQIDMAAETTLRAHGANALLTAKNIAKINAEQIQVG